MDDKPTPFEPGQNQTAVNFKIDLAVRIVEVQVCSQNQTAVTFMMDNDLLAWWVNYPEEHQNQVLNKAVRDSMEKMTALIAEQRAISDAEPRTVWMKPGTTFTV